MLFSTNFFENAEEGDLIVSKIHHYTWICDQMDKSCVREHILQITDIIKVC